MKREFLSKIQRPNFANRTVGSNPICPPTSPLFLQINFGIFKLSRKFRELASQNSLVAGPENDIWRMLAADGSPILRSPIWRSG